MTTPILADINMNPSSSIHCEDSCNCRFFLCLPFRAAQRQIKKPIKAVGKVFDVFKETLSNSKTIDLP